MRSDNGRRSKGGVTARHDSFKRAQYFKPPAGGTNFVVLDPDVAMVFRDPKSVNDVLRSLIRVADKVVRKTLPPA